jgi:hypothetical protein
MPPTLSSGIAGLIAAYWVHKTSLFGFINLQFGIYYSSYISLHTGTKVCIGQGVIPSKQHTVGASRGRAAVAWMDRLQRWWPILCQYRLIHGTAQYTYMCIHQPAHVDTP